MRIRLFDIWTDMQPLMRDIVSDVGGNWDLLQTTESLADSRLFHHAARIQCSRCADFSNRYANYRRRRRRLRRRFAYSVPSLESLQYIAANSSTLLEIGCGNGYWCKLLRSLGAHIVATDCHSSDNNGWVDGAAFVSDVVVASNPEVLIQQMKPSGLMIQWVPRGDLADYAIKAIRSLKGRDFFLTGEPEGGASASSSFFRHLTTGWRLVCRISLPRFPGIIDSLYHYRRF